MFMSDIYNNDYPGPSHRIKKTVAVSRMYNLVFFPRVVLLFIGKFEPFRL